MTHSLDHLSLSDITIRINAAAKATADAPDIDYGDDYMDAAVLAPLVRQEGAWHLLYIRRARHEGDYHSGQVAFAGGKREPEDVDLQDTAKREAFEEIGLQPQDINVLGELGLHHSISRFRITPVVAHVPWPYPLKLESREVARAFTIPLTWLAQPSNYTIENYQTSDFGCIPVVEFQRFDGERLWGATARMTLSLVSLLQS